MVFFPVLGVKTQTVEKSLYFRYSQGEKRHGTTRNLKGMNRNNFKSWTTLCSNIFYFSHFKRSKQDHIVYYHFLHSICTLWKITYLTLTAAVKFCSINLFIFRQINFKCLSFIYDFMFFFLIIFSFKLENGQLPKRTSIVYNIKPD